jgi:glucokinase
MILTGDIGGTNTRIALVDEDSDGLEVKVEEVYPSADHAGLVEILRDFRRAHAARLDCAGFGIAGPVKSGRVRATNLPWTVEARELAHELGLSQVALVNDLEAMANGIAALGPDDLVCLNEGAPGAHGNRAVIAAGTGLGTAGLVFDGRDHWAVASEGGHADFAPADDLQDELLWFLRAESRRVEVEHILSGAGLLRIYRFLERTGRGEEPDWLAEELKLGDPAAAISRLAIEGRSKLCEDTLDVFVRIYGAQAGNLGLVFLATGGVYLGGGIAPKILPKLKGKAFLEGFLGRGALQPVVEAMPVNVIVNEACSLFGAARSATRLVQRPQGASSRRDVRVYAGAPELARAAREEFVAAARASIEAKGSFSVALAGGKTPTLLYELLADASLAWENVQIFFGDERCVPPDHPGSNYRTAREALLSKVPIPEANVHRIRAEILSPSRAAFEYEAEIRKTFGVDALTVPRFDLVLLGMGSDGHTASLFPGTTGLAERDRLVVAHWVPRLESQRVTMTLRLLNAAELVIFLVAGEEKATVARAVLQAGTMENALPARLVDPVDGRVIWMLDRAAAEKLERKV